MRLVPSGSPRRPRGEPAQAAAASGGTELEQFRLLVASVTDYAIFIVDPDGHIRTWNAGAQRIKGYTADEIVGRHLSTFYTEEDRARDHPAEALYTAATEGRFTEEGWRVRSDGTRFWASVVITALREDDGKLVGFAKVTRDLTERRAAEERLRTEIHRLRRRAVALERVGRAIVASLNLEDIVQLATDAATELTGAAFGAFFYNVDDDDGEKYMLYNISGVPREAFSRFPMPRNTAVFAPTFRGEGVVRSHDITADPRYGHNSPYSGMPEGHLPVRSYLAVPVTTSAGDVAGGLFFGHPEAGVFDQEAEDAAQSIAASAAVALVNAQLLEDARREALARQAALEERDRVSHVLQQSLLPPDLPEIPGLELGARYQAGTELVGGDFYDVFSLGERRWGIVVGDVCGSGPEAASRTALSRHSVRTASMFDSDPAHVLQALNVALRRSGSDRFTTAVFGRLEPRRSGPGFTVCLAAGGHPPVLLCHRDGTTEEIAPTGPLLGVIDHAPLGARELDLMPGDTLVLYTDGLVEARRNGELFGPDRLREAITRLRHRSPDELAEELVRTTREFAGAPVSDDIAVVVLRVPERA